MRVKIGPYKSWFGPYQLAKALMFWVPDEKDEYGIPYTADRVHRFGEWLAYGSVKPKPKVGEVYALLSDERKPTLLHRFLLWIDQKKQRKIHVHIDPWDTWSMDVTLGYIVRPMLKQLKETMHGSPMVDDDDVPEHLRSTAAPPRENDYDIDDNHHLRWDWVLDEMIFAFDSLSGGPNQDWEEQFTKGNYDYRWKKMENGCSQMVHGENHTAETDRDAVKEYQKRIANGFRLFGKYYTALWD